MNAVKPEIAKSPEFEVYVLYHLSHLQAKREAIPRASPTDQDANEVVVKELDSIDDRLQRASPRLFLILPSDLKLWDDSDPTTHSFRLYFMCDCLDQSAGESYPTFVHVPSHPGHNLDQPREFIRQFGRLSLIILEAVKRYTGHTCRIPKLDSFLMLRSVGDNPIQHWLTPETLEPLINKAIAYTQEQLSLESQSKRQDNYYMGYLADMVTSLFRRRRSQESQPKKYMCVRSFVRPQHGDNGLGGLNRVLALKKARWLCKSHAFVRPSNEALEGYARSRGGNIDLQMTTITIDFSSLGSQRIRCSIFTGWLLFRSLNQFHAEHIEERTPDFSPTDLQMSTQRPPNREQNIHSWARSTRVQRGSNRISVGNRD